MQRFLRRSLCRCYSLLLLETTLFLFFQFRQIHFIIQTLSLSLFTWQWSANHVPFFHFCLCESPPTFSTSQQVSVFKTSKVSQHSLNSLTPPPPPPNTHFTFTFTFTYTFIFTLYLSLTHCLFIFFQTLHRKIFLVLFSLSLTQSHALNLYIVSLSLSLSLIYLYIYIYICKALISHGLFSVQNCPPSFP